MIYIIIIYYMIAEPKKYIENDEDIKSCISRSKSNDSLFSISSIESCSRSYDSLSELLSKSVEPKNESKYSISDDTNFKKNVDGWIPLCKRKRRKRDDTIENSTIQMASVSNNVDASNEESIGTTESFVINGALSSVERLRAIEDIRAIFQTLGIGS